MTKRTLLFAVFLFVSTFLGSQTLSSSAINPVVDSLLQNSLNALGENDIEKAFSILDKAEVITLENSDKESTDYGKICLYRGIIFEAKTEYPKAEEWYLKSKEIQQNGKKQEAYLESISKLGSLYGKMNKYDDSERFLQEAATLHEEVFENAHPGYYANIANLGILYETTGQFEKAELIMLDAKNNIAKTRGKENMEYTEALKNLGIFYGKTGKYAQSEALLSESKDIISNIMGKDNMSYGENLFIQGTLYFQMGNFSAAKQSFLEAKSIVEKLMGTENVYYAYCLLDLGNVYSRIEEYENAESAYLEGMTVMEKTVGKNHTYRALALVNLGAMYQTRGSHQEALPLLLESKNIMEEILGKEHPDYAESLIVLGINYSFLSEEKQAEILLLEAKQILENNFGKEHLSYIETLTRLGNVNVTLGNIEKAEAFYLEASEIQKTLVIKGMYHLSERELSEYIKSFVDAQNINLSFAQKYSKLAAVSYDNALFYKGFLLNAVKKINQSAEDNNISRENLMKLKSYQRQLAVEYVKPIQQRNRVNELEEQANKVEKELSRSAANFGENIRQVKWAEVQAKLKPGEVAIEFLHYQFHSPKPVENKNSTLYVAFLLKSGDKEPQFIPLFEEETLEKLFKNTTSRRMDYVNNLYVNNADLLYNTIWKPLEKELSDAKTIYYAASGLLHLVNIGALSNPKEEEMTLTNTYQLRRLNSTRELVIKPAENKERLTASLFGGIQYERKGMPIKNTANISSTRGELVFSQVDSTLRANREWPYLESTSEEISEVSSILKERKTAVNLLKGTTATEETFKALSKTQSKNSPNIIHIATHGYFFPNPSSKNINSSSGTESVFKITDHPMIRSGLLFAGSNYAWQNGEPIASGMEDGILTAYEISQMNLSDTELVVLSACETGLGDIKGNEGVYGLQRAFKIAGVKNILMSLWQVPDYQTKELMVRFYKNWLEEDMEIHEALKLAQYAMRAEGYEPFHWAGFILLE